MGVEEAPHIGDVSEDDLLLEPGLEEDWSKMGSN